MSTSVSCRVRTEPKVSLVVMVGVLILVRVSVCVTRPVAVEHWKKRRAPRPAEVPRPVST